MEWWLRQIMNLNPTRLSGHRHRAEVQAKQKQYRMTGKFVNGWSILRCGCTLAVESADSFGQWLSLSLASPDHGGWKEAP